MLFDLLFGIMISMIIVAPCMVIFNLEGHFKRYANMMIYEIVCYIIGIPLTLWLVAEYELAYMPYIWYIYAFLPFGAAVYLYMKYGKSPNTDIKKAAKAASLLYAAVLAVLTVCMWRYSIEKEGLASTMLFVGYATLVPVNYVITAVSETVFQLFKLEV